MVQLTRYPLKTTTVFRASFAEQPSLLLLLQAENELLEIVLSLESWPYKVYS